MATKKERSLLLGKFAQTAIFLSLSDRGFGTFHAGMTFGLNKAGNILGISDGRFARLEQDALEWARENCPAYDNNKQCVLGCSKCTPKRLIKELEIK